jgi:hypothetical protein
MSKPIKRFDFKMVDIDAMISHLTVVNWPDVFLVNEIKACVGQFYDVIEECFDLYVPKFVFGGPDVKFILGLTRSFAIWTIARPRPISL